MTPKPSTPKTLPIRSIESSQQILIAYDPNIAGAPLYDTANNNLEAFIFSVMNSSALDFTPPQITGEPSVEPSGQSINIAFSEMVDVDDELAARSAFKVSVDGTALSNDEFSLNANGGASLQINLNDRVYNDQIVTVDYDPSVLNNTAAELKDNNGNFVASFNQLVNTSAIEESAPNLQPPQLTSSNTSTDGEYISLIFSEGLLGSLEPNTFQIVLDGRNLGMGAVESISQNFNADGSSIVDIKLFSNQAVGQGQSLVVSYDPAFSSSPLADSLGNPVDAFQQAVNNSSTAAPQDFDDPQVIQGNADPQGQFIIIQFDEHLQATDLDSLKSALRVVVDGHELPSVDAIESLSINNFGDPETDTISDLFITLRPESRIKQGQSVFVSYDMDMAMAFAPGLQDLSGNFVHNFTQVIDNLSQVFNDQEAPTLFAPPELNPDGQTFTLQFSEPLDTQTINTQNIAHSFRVFVDGNDFADNFDAGPRPLFDDNATNLFSRRYLSNAQARWTIDREFSANSHRL